MSPADIAILVILGISALVGLIRGFIKEVFSLVVWAVALSLSFLYRSQVGQKLPLDSELNPLITELVGAAVIFVIVIIAGGVISNLLSKLAEVTGLSGTDRTLGSVFGLVRGLIIVLAILIFLPPIIPVEEASWWRESLLIPEFLAFESWALEVLGSFTSWIASFFNGTE